MHSPYLDATLSQVLYAAYTVPGPADDALHVHVYRVGSEADPAVIGHIAAITGVTAQYTIPLSAVSLASSSYFPVFQYMGELPAIRLYTTAVMYSDNGCMHKQAADKHTLLNPAAKSFTLNHEGGKYISKKTGYTHTCIA